MDAAEHDSEQLPTASLMGETLSYSREIASDMPWVLRFVGCFIIFHNATSLVSLSANVRQFVPGPFFWPQLLGLLTISLGIVAGVGICTRRRAALWVALALCLYPVAAYSFMMQGGSAVTVWLWKLPTAVALIWLLVRLYQRAERSGILLPARADPGRGPAAGDDILWLARCVGVYLLFPAITALSAFLLPPTNVRIAGFWEFPAAIVVGISTAGLSALFGVALLLRRYRILIVYACVALLSPAIGEVALYWDYTRSGGSAWPLATSRFWTDIGGAMISGIVSAGFCIVLHRKARGRA